MRRSRVLAGRLLITAGCLALVLGGAGWAEGAAARSRVRSEWDAREAERAVARARATMSEVVAATSPAPGSPVARLVIPAIGLDEIVVEGVGTRELNAGPGHIPETPLPGQPGNAAVSAHRDRHFAAFDKLSIGDEVHTETELGTTRWSVTSIRIVDKDAPSIARTSDRRLTLTTCWPIRWFGSAPHRLIVTAEPIDRR